MKIICRQNCSGKTKELIKESLDTGTPILTLNTTKKKSLEEKSMAYFSEVVKTISLDEAKDYCGDVLLDDIDKNINLLLKIAVQNPQISLSAATISTD